MRSLYGSSLRAVAKEQNSAKAPRRNNHATADPHHGGGASPVPVSPALELITVRNAPAEPIRVGWKTTANAQLPFGPRFIGQSLFAIKNSSASVPANIGTTACVVLLTLDTVNGWA